jgi:hypothetical protein
MGLFLKFAIVVVLIGLFAAGLLSVLAELFSRFSADPFLRPEDLGGADPHYDDSEVLSNRRDGDRAALS